jgi:hypothetical protein
MVEALPKCREHNFAIQLVRVEISEDKIVTNVYRCPHPGCKTEHYSRETLPTVESGE